MPDSNTIETIKAVGAIVTPIVLAWIAYLQIKMGKKQDVANKQMDGMKTELVQAVKGQYQAEGELKGKADQKIIEKANQDEKATAVDIALHTTVPGTAVDVNIVDQDKPVEVTNKKK